MKKPSAAESKKMSCPTGGFVERTFGWLNHSRRFGKGYVRRTRTDETRIDIAMTRIMLNRLA